MRFANLTTEEKEKLKEYVDSVKEIQKEINALLEKSGCRLRTEDEFNHNMSSGLVKSIEEKKQKK